MSEEELRAAFARHEDLTPAAGPVRAAVDTRVVRVRRRRLVLRAGLACALVLLSLAALPFVVLPRLTGPVSVAASPPPARPLTLLLLGTDRRTEPAADAVQVVHVGADGAVHLIAVPRDAPVDVPGHGRQKVSHAYVLGGADLTERAVAAATGLTFDAVLVADLAAVHRVTDAVGGVRMCLDRDVPSIHTGRLYPAGCTGYTGRDAADLLRQRKGLPQGMHDRDRHAQGYLRALAAKVLADGGPGDPVRAAGLLTAAGDGLQVLHRRASLAELAGAAGRVRPERITGISTPASDRQGPPAGLYPEVGPSLFAAARDGTLATWAVAHPEWVQR